MVCLKGNFVIYSLDVATMTSQTVYNAQSGLNVQIPAQRCSFFATQGQRVKIGAPEVLTDQGKRSTFQLDVRVAQLQDSVLFARSVLSNGRLRARQEALCDVSATLSFQSGA